MPEVITADDHYMPSPAFNDGRFSLDHFADANSLDQQGLVTAQLANGDMVVAGLVRMGLAEDFAVMEPSYAVWTCPIQRERTACCLDESWQR